MKRLLGPAVLVLAVAGCDCGGAPAGGGGHDAAVADSGGSRDASVDGGADAGRDGGGDAGRDAGTDGGGDAGAADAAAPDGGSRDAGEDGGPADAGTVDAGADAGAADAGTADAGPALSHVHIYISNTCVVSTSPTDATVPAGQRVRFEWHNHSVDYDADIWYSSIYGYLGLATGATWDDPIDWCGGPQPYDGYADVSIAGGGSSACPSVRFAIHCQ